MVNSRTLLTEYSTEGLTEYSTECRVGYSIIASRLVAMGGFQCNTIEARVVDDHFLLIRANTVKNFDYEPFGIVDLKHPQVALNRIYDEAKRLAKERAKRDGNKVLDLTSRGNRVKGEDKYYVPDEYLHRCV